MQTPNDEFTGPVHNFSSMSFGFEEPTVISQEKRRVSAAISSKSLDSYKRRYVAHNLGHMHRGDTVKKKHTKKHSTTCEGLHPVRERDYVRNKLNQKVDLRYVKEINTFTQKKSFILHNCDQVQCPIIKERLKQHRSEHHHKCHHKVHHPKEMNERGVTVTPTSSAFPPSTLKLARDISVKSIQTDITLNDVITPQDMEKNSKDVFLNFIELDSHKCTYKEHLQNEILTWLLNVPIFYSLDFTAKYLKDNIVTILLNRIERLIPQMHSESYEATVKHEIEDCLNLLPMWLPNAKQDQTLFKNGLIVKFYEKLKDLNAKFLDVQYETNNVKETGVTNCEICLEDNCENELFVKEVDSWLGKIRFNKPLPRKQITELIMRRISSLLTVPIHTTSYKLILKGEIVEVLDDLPVYVVNVKNRTVHLNKYAENLANRIMSLQIKMESPRNRSSSRQSNEHKVFHQWSSQIVGEPYNQLLRQSVQDNVSKALGSMKFYNGDDTKAEICDVLLNSLETLRLGIENKISHRICAILHKASNITADRAMRVAKKIKLYVKVALTQDKGTKPCSYCSLKPQLSGAVSIYRSNSNIPVTSTPKKPTKKDIPKLNPEEKSYMEKVAALIRSWMNTLPTKFDDDLNYKETMINDLAGDIMDEVKRGQLSPVAKKGKDKQLKYILFRWLVRFNVFDDLNDAKPVAETFLIKLKQIPEPDLTASQHGTRQAMQNLQLMEGVFGWDEDFVPTGINVLEDQISVWMNEQPSEIYANNNKKYRNKMVKDLAIIIQDRLRNNDPEDVIVEDINRWLDQVVKSEEKEHIGLLTQNLKEKIINVPQDETLEARVEKKKRQRAEYQQSGPSTSIPESGTATSYQEDPDRTMKEFILKYLEHNYDIDDPMARGAFGQLLITELRKLSPPTRKEVYDNFTKETLPEKFKPEKLNDVLEFIKLISDWLKNIPINPLYNTPGNRPRVDFVNDLAKNIQEVEDQRKEDPHEMDYDLFIASVIRESIRTYNIPVLPEHKDNIHLMVNQLVSKIIANRSKIQHDDSTITDIKQQNLSEFIHEYIRVNGREIAEDDVKLEAWTARLLEEVKKMIHEGADPSTLCKAQVYEKFSEVRIPSNESVRRFGLKISYVKEISDWLKNLPLLPIASIPEAQQERIDMISELTQKIAEREIKRNSDPNDNTADNDLVEYITNWISKLPLDPRKEIVVPILTQQLMNRVDKICRKKQTLSEKFEPKGNISTEITISDAESNIDPGTRIVEFIEAWCNSLPIQGDDDAALSHLKSNIAKNLYQKIGELNADPRVYNDEILFRDLLEDEIDTHFENMPQSSNLQDNKDQLKTKLLNYILGMKKIIERKSTGDNYKHQLKTTIDAAIPDPVQSRQIIEPGFEIYKNHLANMFILDNFDHSDVEVKKIYERRIKDEINKYFESAQKKNALPITRDQMYNELYSELFKVPMPKKEAVIDEVEEIKTRCEIDAWFQDLPLRKADIASRYLEWDQILSTLVRRIHDIEKKESDPDEKIRKEIRKWLQKLPFLPGQEGNMDQFVDKLQTALKLSVEGRKYVATEPIRASKSKMVVRNKAKQTSTSQIRGPGTCCKRATPHKRSGDLIVEIVENWCNQLPLVGNEAQNKIIKDDLSTKLVMKICELNTDADIFNDDIIYAQLLDEDLEKKIASLGKCDGLERSKDARKHQLIEMIKSVKPMIKKEKERHDYKAELYSTVASILNNHNNTADKNAEFNKLKNEIVDNFVEYNFNKDDDEAKQVYKRKIHDAVVKYVVDIKDEGEQEDPLVRRNQLLCELSKVPVPNNAVLKEEVEEIKMKNEVERLYKAVSIDDNTEKTAQIKKTLTKRLNEIEKSGHTNTNDKKMHSEITRCLKKLDIDPPPQIIGDFVKSLKYNEAERKASPMHILLPNEVDMFRRQSPTIVASKPGDSRAAKTLPAPPHPANKQLTGTSQTVGQQPGQYLQVPPLHDQSHCSPKEQLIPSQEDTTPNQDIYHIPSNVHGYGPGSDSVWNIQPTDQSQYEPGKYEDFKAVQPLLNSTMAPQAFSAYSGQNSPLNQSSDIIPPHRDRFIPDQGPGGSGYPAQQNNSCCEPTNASQRPYNASNASQVPQNDQNYGQYPQALPPQSNQSSGDKNYDSSSQPSFDKLEKPKIADLSQGQSMNYEWFKRGPMLRSSMSPQEYFEAEQLVHSHVSPYRSPDQRSVNEVPNYGQVATPRQVQGEARTFEFESTCDITPESLFEAPQFVPKPLYSRISSPGQPSEASLSSPASVLSSGRYCIPAVRGKRWKLPRNVESSADGVYRCTCDKSLKKYDSGPYCMIPMEEFCDDCGGFCPMWCQMPLPGYLYMN